MRRLISARSITGLSLSLFCFASTLLSDSTFAKDYESLDALRVDRKKLAFQKRRIIANNDGCDCIYFPKNIEPGAENLLALRTTILEGSDVKVFVDGKLRIDARGAMTASSSYPRNEICFGGSNHDGPGSAKWQRVRFRSERKGFALQDIALSVDYRKHD